MTGSIQEKNGFWQMVLSYKDENGKWKQKWLSTKLKLRGNKKKAQDMLDTYLQEHDDRQFWKKNMMFFEEFMLKWLETAKIEIEKSTYLAYKYQIESQIVPYFKPLKLTVGEIDSQILQDYYNKKLETLSGNTVRKQHANIHKALNYAIFSRIIKYNPADYVILPKKEKYHAKFYNADEAIKALRIFKGDVLETAVFLTLHYGLRRSEVIGLKWDDIDFKENLIHIRNTVKTVNGTIIEEESTKNESSRRILPLLPNVKKHLLMLQIKQKEEKLFYGDTYFPTYYICRWENGKPLKPDYVTRHFKKVLVDNDMKVIRFHDLRHSTASILLGLGMDLKDIQEWLGHEEISTTNMYAHLQFDRKKVIGNTMITALENVI